MEPIAGTTQLSRRQNTKIPEDPGAYAELSTLQCVRRTDADPESDILLCSLCSEVALGEPLLDEHDNETEHRIAFYALPYPKGIFHHICHACDGQLLSIQPDLRSVLESIDMSVPPDMSWAHVPYDEKSRKASTKTPQALYEEINELSLETPNSRRKRPFDPSASTPSTKRLLRSSLRGNSRLTRSPQQPQGDG
ncbi:MAG: hypothetical protein Q9220_006086 [cf. Caloplaca sp. 1 TL-2023]